jgi:hypothetical protein
MRKLRSSRQEKIGSFGKDDSVSLKKTSVVVTNEIEEAVIEKAWRDHRVRSCAEPVSREQRHRSRSRD